MSTVPPHCEKSNMQLDADLRLNPVAIRRLRDREPGLMLASAVPHRPLQNWTHDHATLVYYTAGNATFEQDGHWQLGPGDVLLIPAGQAHRRLTAQHSEYWGLGICMPCFGTREASALPDPFERVRRGASAVVPISPSRQSFTNGLFQELANATGNGHPSNAAVQRSLLTLILHEVQTAQDDTAPTATTNGGTATEALRFIEDNCMHPLTLQQVARAVGRSASHVTTSVSRATGKSVTQWITALRIARARTLLLHSTERVDIIAERVGYRDTTHFIRMFRRTVGVTPTAYRAHSLRKSQAKS